MGHQRWSTAAVNSAAVFDQLRTEFEVASPYPEAAVQQASNTVDAYAAERVDRTDIPFVTIDPPGSMDLDQALHVACTASGFVVHYAIADVAAVVEPDGPLDVETRRRGQTFYFPDTSVPLHPRELSEGTASLLPNQIRAAALWEIETDSQGNPTRTRVTRALVKSVQRFDYAEVQADVDAGKVHASIAALPEFGQLRLARARERGAINLRLPDQEVAPADGGGWQLRLAPRTDVDSWNAEISLLTGMCAAQLMLSAKVGILRTLPPASDEAKRNLLEAARSLGVKWDTSTQVGPALADLDATLPSSVALMSYATGLLRGASYTVFDGAVPELVEHSAIGAAYAHVTAPLRRLSDRFATEICLAVCAGKPAPDWARSALVGIAETMRESDSKANKVDRACVDLTEALVLAPHVGEQFDAVVLRVAVPGREAEIFIAEPPVIAKCAGEPEQASSIVVQLVEADAPGRVVRFKEVG